MRWMKKSVHWRILLSDMALSRAGSLPQWIVVNAECVIDTNPVGASLLAKGPVQAPMHSLHKTHSPNALAEHPH